MLKLELNQLDVFYISYDEPNAEKHWADLLTKAPWARRIHGVKGFDAAHKACAEASDTSHFITIDGDNIVYPDFFDQVLTIPEHQADCVFSWNSKNVINGLGYGNGGLKLWPVEQTLAMQTHENAIEERRALDFCWDNKYIQLNNMYSETHPNGSAFQAFRAGFREGVKMTVHSGQKLDPGKLASQVHYTNLKRILIWMSVGMDVENGYWAMIGARDGLIQANLRPNFNILQVRDYDWFKMYFDGAWKPLRDGNWDAKVVLDAQEEEIRRMAGIKVVTLDAHQSAFFKEVYEYPRRTSALVTEAEAMQGKG